MKEIHKTTNFFSFIHFHTLVNRLDAIRHSKLIIPWIPVETVADSVVRRDGRTVGLATAGDAELALLVGSPRPVLVSQAVSPG